MRRHFKKILVANRGEIAVRILRTCQELGIGTVAVYSEPDRWAPHVAMADEAWPLDGTAPRDTYLRADLLVSIAERSGCQAIHPGYGFLSEDDRFAARCERAGLRFIGPSSATLRRLGDKLAARALAQRLGVPVLPARKISDGAGRQTLERWAREIGLPLLLKAASGGGGRGMRIVRSAKELVPAVREASSEVQAAFGDRTLFMEKWLERPRHVEIQVIADAHGNTVALGERECSVQRRYQKLVEESPSPAVDEDLRARMSEAACRLARAGRYTNAGTVEFLLDRKGNFTFLEVNTRLQVEHPVTEMRTTVDLVAAQIAVSEGRELPREVRSIALSESRSGSGRVEGRGSAIECRISAEDPFENFAPSVGRVTAIEWPQGPFVRVDAGITVGQEVTPYYDPLLAKVIVWAPSRQQAIARMVRALSETTLVGVSTTIPFHLRLLESKPFRSGKLHTGLAAEILAETAPVRSEDHLLAAALASALEYRRRTGLGLATAGPASRLSSWKLAFRTTNGADPLSLKLRRTGKR